MSSNKDKMLYYEKRAQDRIEQAGRYLNDAINTHNQVGQLLQDATNFLNLAAGLSVVVEVEEKQANEVKSKQDGEVSDDSLQVQKEAKDNPAPVRDK